jgi:hypothetical protein
MSRTNTDQIIAHVDLLRSIDRLLMEAETVRAKRAALDELLAGNPASIEERKRRRRRHAGKEAADAE